MIYRLWVGEWAEPVIVLLSSCIPEAQVHWFAVHHHISRVVVKSMGGKRMRSAINQTISELLFHLLNSLVINHLIYERQRDAIKPMGSHNETCHSRSQRGLQSIKKIQLKKKIYICRQFQFHISLE